MSPVLNFIDGAFLPAQSGDTLDTVNPATGEVITTLPKSSSSDVQAATEAALRAAPAWAATTMDERIAWLHRLADGLEEDGETIAQLESKDTGKPIALARRVDAARSVSNFRFFAEFGEQHSDPTFTGLEDRGIKPVESSDQVGMTDHRLPNPVVFLVSDESGVDLCQFRHGV